MSAVKATKYLVNLQVYDEDSDAIAIFNVGYDHRDNAMRAFGHAVEGLNKGERDQRVTREIKEACERLEKDNAARAGATQKDPSQ